MYIYIYTANNGTHSIRPDGIAHTAEYPTHVVSRSFSLVFSFYFFLFFFVYKLMPGTYCRTHVARCQHWTSTSYKSEIGTLRDGVEHAKRSPPLCVVPIMKICFSPNTLPQNARIPKYSNEKRAGKKKRNNFDNDDGNDGDAAHSRRMWNTVRFPFFHSFSTISSRRRTYVATAGWVKRRISLFAAIDRLLFTHWKFIIFQFISHHIISLGIFRRAVVRAPHSQAPDMIFKKKKKGRQRKKKEQTFASIFGRFRWEMGKTAAANSSTWTCELRVFCAWRARYLFYLSPGLNLLIRLCAKCDKM